MTSTEGCQPPALVIRNISLQGSTELVLESVYCLLSLTLLFFLPSRAGQAQTPFKSVSSLSKSNAGLVRPAYQIVEGRACSAPQDTNFPGAGNAYDRQSEVVQRCEGLWLYHT